MLYDCLPSNDLECWRHFVLASWLLYQYDITHRDLQLADALLLQCCRHCERSDMYDKKFITPNMHMHAHFKECVIDYGPIHGFWLYSFKRYNGILELLPSNNRSIEIQLMQRFTRDFQLASVDLPEQFESEFQSCLVRPQLRGSLSAKFRTLYCIPSSSINHWLASDNEFILPKSFTCVCVTCLYSPL